MTVFSIHQEKFIAVKDGGQRLRRRRGDVNEVAVIESRAPFPVQRGRPRRGRTRRWDRLLIRNRRRQARSTHLRRARLRRARCGKPSRNSQTDEQPAQSYPHRSLLVQGRPSPTLLHVWVGDEQKVARRRAACAKCKVNRYASSSAQRATPSSCAESRQRTADYKASHGAAKAYPTSRAAATRQLDDGQNKASIRLSSGWALVSFHEFATGVMFAQLPQLHWERGC